MLLSIWRARRNDRAKFDWLFWQQSDLGWAEYFYVACAGRCRTAC